MKTLLIDLENGYKSIGSKEVIEQKLGLPLLNFNDFTSFRNFIGQLWSRKMVERDVNVGGVSVKQKSYQVIAKEGVEIDCMVINTASEMSKKYARELKGKAESLQPYIEGSTKVDVGKWFDFVFYTKVHKAKDGTRKYMWVTARDEHYCHAKDRTQLLNAEIEQDYSIVFNAVKEKGWDSAKILVIGEPGSGKTLSLKTLTKVK